MKKIIVLAALAMLLLAFFPEAQGKSQNAVVKNGIDGGHHNTIVTNVDQISQIANKNNMPYGQIKKIASDEWGSGNSDYGLSQNMNIQNQIFGGHHNMILLSSIQVAKINALSLGNLSQEANINNQIEGGHHNVIVVGSSQLASLKGIA